MTRTEMLLHHQKISTEESVCFSEKLNFEELTKRNGHIPSPRVSEQGEMIKFFI